MRKFWLSAAALILTAAPSLGTVVIIGNMPQANDATQSAGLNNLRVKAIQFIMPAGPGYYLHEVVLRLGNYDPGDTPIVEIRNDTGSGSPGTTTIASLTLAPGTGPAIANYSATPTATTILAGGVSYWLFVGGVAGQSFEWWASSPGIIPTGVATYGLNRFSINGGTGWTASTIINTFRINGKEVPAPGALALFGLGGLLAGRRRR